MVSSKRNDEGAPLLPSVLDRFFCCSYSSTQLQSEDDDDDNNNIATIMASKWIQQTFSGFSYQSTTRRLSLTLESFMPSSFMPESTFSQDHNEPQLKGGALGVISKTTNAPSDDPCKQLQNTTTNNESISRVAESRAKREKSLLQDTDAAKSAISQHSIVCQSEESLIENSFSFESGRHHSLLDIDDDRDEEEQLLQKDTDDLPLFLSTRDAPSSPYYLGVALPSQRQQDSHHHLNTVDDHQKKAQTFIGGKSNNAMLS